MRELHRIVSFNRSSAARYKSVLRLFGKKEKKSRSTTCDGCMYLTYRLRDTTDGYFKWCMRCYRFKSLSTFAGKLDSSTCDCCRKKHTDACKRKRKADADEAEADAPTA